MVAGTRWRRRTVLMAGIPCCLSTAVQSAHHLSAARGRRHIRRVQDNPNLRAAKNTSAIARPPISCLQAIVARAAAAFGGVSARTEFESSKGFVSNTLINDRISWLAFLDTYRTLCVAPEPQFRRVLEEIQGMRHAA
jgi:hypothetical protein